MYRYLYFLLCIVLIGAAFPGRSQIITTFAGNGTAGYTGDGGPAFLATLDTPTALAIDKHGNIYINDQINYCVRKVSPSGVITTVAGNGLHGNAGENVVATTAPLGTNWGVAVDTAGNIYITDQDNHKVRKVNTAGYMTTYAGTGVPGSTGDGGQATNATLYRPIGIAVDLAGNVYVGDADTFLVRKITPSGIISTVAGNGLQGFIGDGGPATDARLSNGIFGLATDASGNLYICDGNNNRIRRVTPSGVINTVAGNGAPPGFGGDGGQATAATLNKPLSVFVANNVLYFSDCDNNRVRKVLKNGEIRTIAGTGTPGYNGDNIPATNARLNGPIGIVVDTAENIYFSDHHNSRVRRINNILSFIYGDDEAITICQDAGPVSLNDILSARDIYVGLSDVWTMYQPPVHGTAVVGYSATSTGGVTTPTGLTYTPDAGYAGLDSFSVRVANSLSTDVITIYVTVDPLLDPGVITGSPTVCFGDTLELTNTATGGTWSTTNGKLLLTVVGGVCKAKANSLGLDTIKYTVNNACGTAFTYKAVTVNPLPDPGSISGPTAICLGSTATFTASITGGTWSTSNMAIGTVNNGGQLKGLAAGTVVVVYTTSNTWCLASAIQVVDIETFPDAGAVTGPIDVCLGQQVTLTDTMVGGTWSSDNGVTTVTNGVVTGVALGNGFVFYKVTNSCGTDVATQPMTVHPLPEVPLISLTQGLLSASKGYMGYQWRLNGAEITGAVSDTLFAETPGKYQVAVSNTFGCMSLSGTLDYEGCTADDVRMYPNPSNGTVQVDWCRKVSARLVTIDGREVGKALEVNTIEISALPPGIYLLVVYDGNGARVKTYKLVLLR